jgi:hypothetical protein
MGTRVNLGATVRDIITGFSGVVTGRVEYLSGCNQSLVQPRVGDDGTHRGPEWFDEQRLVTDPDVPAIALDNGATPGFDRAAPKR